VNRLRQGTEFPDRWLGAETLRFGDRELRVIPTPGHTKGHVVYLDERRGLLFSGDHVLPHITRAGSRRTSAYRVIRWSESR
jgi:glyoxylase-like metal-dependent hydrolase (beta-lactamase superfamily II)